MFAKLKYWKNIRVVQSIYYCIRFGVVKHKQIVLYPKSKLFIDKTAKLILGKGFFICNFSHYGTRFRRKTAVLFVGEKAKFEIEKDHFTMCEGSSITIRNGGYLHVKGHAFINEDARIDCTDNIEIGENTIISNYVYISDSNVHEYEGKENIRGIIIGNHVWIGYAAKIMKGVHIGNNCVVAAGAVVTHDIPDNCMAAGVPAKVIKENISWKF